MWTQIRIPMYTGYYLKVYRFASSPCIALLYNLVFFMLYESVQTLESTNLTQYSIIHNLFFFNSAQLFVSIMLQIMLFNNIGHELICGWFDLTFREWQMNWNTRRLFQPLILKIWMIMWMLMTLHGTWFCRC